MNIRGDVRQSGPWRQLLLQLVLLAFVCRALVPVGYMPDVGRFSKTGFSVVICTALGSQSIEVDAAGHKMPARGATHHQPCAFSALAALANLKAAEIDIAPNDLAIAISAPIAFESVRSFRVGPPLGSRGPPTVS